jgi:hypothetical protein
LSTRNIYSTQTIHPQTIHPQTIHPQEINDPFDEYKKSVFITSSKLWMTCTVAGGITNMIFIGGTFKCLNNISNELLLGIPILYFGIGLSSKILASYYSYKFRHCENEDKKYSAYIINSLAGISNAPLMLTPFYYFDTCASIGSIMFANKTTEETFAHHKNNLCKDSTVMSFIYGVFLPTDFGTVAGNIFTCIHNFNDFHKMNENYKINKYNLYDDALNFSLNTVSPIIKISKHFSEK